MAFAREDELDTGTGIGIGLTKLLAIGGTIGLVSRYLPRPAVMFRAWSIDRARRKGT